MIEAESHEDYKLCEQGDLAINTMWAWMGALGIAWETGIVSPSYNVYRIKNDALLPGYFDYLCRTPAYVCDIIRHSKGVWKSRLRLYPDEFRDVVTLVPPPADQNHIAAYLSREIVKSDALTEKIREGIDRLREYRTALISAAVTGKIDVREETAAADQRYLRNIFAAEIVHRWHDRPTFGHVSAHKIFYLAEMHLRVDEFDGAYQRRAAGPYDSDLMSDIDSSLRERRWYEAVQENGKAKRYWYRPLENAGGHRRDFDLFWGHKKTALDRLLADLDEFDSDGLEVIATLYAAWNDLLIDGKMVTDETLITEVRERWHLEKARIQEETWRLLLAWMKRHGLVPSGRGRKTKVGDLL